MRSAKRTAAAMRVASRSFGPNEGLPSFVREPGSHRILRLPWLQIPLGANATGTSQRLNLTTRTGGAHWQGAAPDLDGDSELSSREYERDTVVKRRAQSRRVSAVASSG